MIRYLKNNADARAQAEKLASALARAAAQSDPSSAFPMRPTRQSRGKSDALSASRRCAVSNPRKASCFAQARSNSTFLATTIWRRSKRLQQGRVTMNRILPVVLVASCLAASVAARAADSSTPANNPPAATKTDVAKTDAAAPAAPAPLVVYFDMGSTTIRNEDKTVLDHASRPSTKASLSS
jgi:hypothetical protein